MKNLHTLEQVDRALYNLLRLAFVQAGILPDITTYPNNPTGASSYHSDKEALATCVELLGIGSRNSRGDKEPHTLIINRSDVIPSVGIGGQNKTVYTPVGDVKANGIYKAEKVPDSALNFEYELRLYTDSAEVLRTVHSILLQTLGTSRYIPVYEDYQTVKEGAYLYCQFRDFVELSDADLLEFRFTFYLLDVWISDSSLSSDIVPITSIDFQTNLLPTQ